MIGYRNACYNPREQTVEVYTWSEEGDRVSYTTKFSPYFFVEDTKGDETSIYNTKLRKKSFGNTFEKNKYLKETGIKRLYENFGATQHCLLDLYWKNNEDDEFSKFPLKTYYIDIEAVAETFPDPATAEHPINVITIYDSLKEKYFSWGLSPYNNKDRSVEYYYCKSEVDLLCGFIEFFKKDPCDILSGWNSAGFDIPYIINRIKNILGDAAVNELSPVKRVFFRTFMGAFGKEQINYHIDGISCVDYLDIYKRFSFTNRESYKLDYIGELELGEKKVDYGERDLFTLMKEDWNLFIDYNIQDVRLLVNLEKKLQYIDLLRMLAYIGLTTFEGAMGTLSVITGATAIRARNRGQRVSTFVRGEDDGSKNPGAYVAEPLQGFQESIVSFDANSLYPNVMISLNMSPETKIGKIIETDDTHITIRHVNGQVFKLTRDKFAKFVKKEEIAISRAKVLFSQKSKGVIPDMVDFYYQKRKVVQKELKAVKKQLLEVTDAQHKKELEIRSTQLNAQQLSIKIYINSCYGYFGNKQAPIGDDDIASSITLTGQAVVKQAKEIAKRYISNLTGITDAATLDTVAIYQDTDSLYLSLKLLQLKLHENNTITKEAHKQIEEIERTLNTQIVHWAKESLNSKDCRFVFKREAVADTGLFLEKKRYVIHVLDDEGLPCDKWKYTGVDVVRTTMPKAVKPYVKQIIETMLSTKSVATTNKVLNEAYEVFNNLPIEDISRTSGIKGYDKYASMCNDFKVAKGMPNHVKAAYYHNLLIDKLKLNRKYEKIVSGDKIKYFYVQQPNKYGIDCIAFKYKYPSEFESLFTPDREMLFEKIVFAAVERFYVAVNWTPRKPSQQVQYELLDLFAE